MQYYKWSGDERISTTIEGYLEEMPITIPNFWLVDRWFSMILEFKGRELNPKFTAH